MAARRTKMTAPRIPPRAALSSSRDSVEKSALAGPEGSPVKSTDSVILSALS